MDKVAILMSTYNGEKYIGEQIESILKQTYKNWHLYIRDDGSKDSTLRIIRNYNKLDKRITLISDNQNLGPFRSFFKLLNIVNADYYFFCDQDDYWLENKLDVMLKKISQQNNQIPQLVYCNLKCVDANLKSQKYGFDELIGKTSGINRFIGNDMPGCVMLFNNETKKFTVKYTTDYNGITMHDWWVALVAQNFGEVTFINQRLIYYRQHGDNAIGAGKSGNSIKKLFQKNLIKKQKRLAKESFLQDMTFRKCFSPILPTQTKSILDEMAVSSKKSFLSRVIFLKKYNFKQMSPIRTFAYYFAFAAFVKNK